MSRRAGRSWPLYGGVLVVVAGLVVGGLMLTGVVGDPDDDRPDRRSLPAVGAPRPSDPTADPGPGDPAGDVLSVQEWGRAAGQLAVLVRNDSRELIASARVRVTARDARGDVVVTTSGSEADVCCTVVGLPAGGEFGLFVPLDPGVGDISSVGIDVLDARTASPRTRAAVEVVGARLLRADDDTVADVRLRAEGRLSGYVAVQALLVDAEGRLAQVISGRFYCFVPGVARPVRLRLFHAVPHDLRLDRVVAQPIPRGVRPHVPGRCR